MNKDVSDSFEFYFGVLKDPRIKRLKLYPLTEILFVLEKTMQVKTWLSFGILRLIC